MTNYSLVRGRALRATRLNGCGNPVLGPDSVVTTDGFITVALTANTEAGTEIRVTNASGKVCVLDQPAPRFVNYGIQVDFCGVNPSLFHLLTGHPLVLDANDEPVGWRSNSKVDPDLVGFALEMWTGVAGNACGLDGDPAYGYTLLPFLKGGVIGDFSVTNDAINFSLTGAITQDGSGWGVGPFDVVRDATGPSPLLTPITDGDHLHTQITDIAPPNATGEPEALGTVATGATSGTPGEFTPTNSYGPFDLAELQASSITASPSTAWATGEYVVLRDGSLAHWDGTAWVSGAA